MIKAARARLRRYLANSGSRELAMAITLMCGAICLALEPVAAWLVEYPDAWVLPVTDTLERWAGCILNTLKPAARGLAWLLEYPMTAINFALATTPWPLMIASLVALGWLVGGLRMALLALSGFCFVLLSGYWDKSMNTLGLVALSLPLALALGGLTGIVAYELPRIRPVVLALLDVMQTMPTFAYLTPLLVLFGFGPVVGLMASAIYAAPPMARNILLALERVDPEVKEAAVMSGSTHTQRLLLVEVPAASAQIMVGVNQCLMAALSMVIIAAVIGGFDDIGWEVLLTMRKAQFGQALLAGLVIVAFAIVIDRMSAALARPRVRHGSRPALVILGVGVLVSLLPAAVLEPMMSGAWLGSLAERIDVGLDEFTIRHGETLNQLKNDAMFFGLLPLRIGLDDAVLGFTWGFNWAAWMSAALLGGACLFAGLLAYYGAVRTAYLVVLLAGIVETGVAELPWPFVIVATAALAHAAQGPRLAAFVVLLLTAVLLSGLWARTLLSLYLVGAAVAACLVLGGSVGLVCAIFPPLWRLIRPVCDMLQTIPLFVFLIPVLMFFQIGEFSAWLAIIAYAVVPMIRYTREGITQTPPELVEAAQASGATDWQILWQVRAPYAAPAILLGVNQTILYAFAMLVIAALIGTTGLGQAIYLALGQADVGLGLGAGLAMAILALVADRLLQALAAQRRAALGLNV